jgi:hypothetical protein
MGGDVKPSGIVSWFVETRGVTLYGRNGNVRQSIPYPHAGIWALITGGNFSKTFAAELMSVLMSVGKHEAEIEVEETLADWKQAGLISEE